jgi:DNA modification methylase
LGHATMITILQGDCRDVLKTLPDCSVHCCVTSPPYYGLRDYGCAGQIGLESTPDAYVAELVAVFREVKRVLRDDGTLWLNLGDSYASFRDGKATPDSTRGDDVGTLVPKGSAMNRMASTFAGSRVKHKDLIGIPWRVAFALQADGWWLRQDIIWHKPNPMPESVRDRCTKAHEYIFLLAKSPRYYYDADAVKEPNSENSRMGGVYQEDGKTRRMRGGAGNDGIHKAGVVNSWSGRNRRDVWSIATQPYSGAHYAVMPPALAEVCIKAGCPAGGTVLDPFGGSGTTGEVAASEGRKAILIELNPEYVKLAENRGGLFVHSN